MPNILPINLNNRMQNGRSMKSFGELNNVAWSDFVNAVLWSIFSIRGRTIWISSVIWVYLNAAKLPIHIEIDISNKFHAVSETLWIRCRRDKVFILVFGQILVISVSIICLLILRISFVYFRHDRKLAYYSSYRCLLGKNEFTNKFC